MGKRALITGITGMDGSHLADFLLLKNYEVFGLIRKVPTPNFNNIKNILKDITIFEGDLTDQNTLKKALEEFNPDEVYNLAAQSFVKESWLTPENTSNITGLGCLRILEAIRNYNKSVKFFQASSSEMFGKMHSKIGRAHV